MDLAPSRRSRLPLTPSLSLFPSLSHTDERRTERKEGRVFCRFAEKPKAPP